MKFAAILFPYSTDMDRGAAGGPDALLGAGLAEWLRQQGHAMLGPFRAALNPAGEASYGAWNKIGLANGALALLTAQAIRQEAFPLILQSNCYAAPGVLAGLQRAASPLSPRLGMVWIDAHGDCNTPETTLSGMLSGMPVAIAAGLCLTRLRLQAGLDPPLAPLNIVMVFVRANDPLEQELIDQSGIEIIPVADVRDNCRKLRAAMQRLSSAVDAIYVHLDIDALDAPEVRSMWLSASGGPKAAELAGALKLIMAYPKIAALGIAGINPERDIDGEIVQAAFAMTKAAITGLAGGF
ncbi:MAG: arginase family protein [Beijerinckiaceae bacterium]|nr:arginase family protein [Beijerinckiaceae bacterium]